MPVGDFLNSFPAMVFIVAHIAFLIVGIWAMRRAVQAGQPFGNALWLYLISQVGFLAYFGGALTLKMAVLLEQMLMLVLVIWLVSARRASA